MADLDWEETRYLQPEEASLKGFCEQRAIAWQGLNLPLGTLVFLEKTALEELYAFFAGRTQSEQGGMLVGKPYYDPEEERLFVVVNKALPAHETRASAVHLQFTPQSWEGISGIIEENYPERVIVGWCHSHPGLGVFMSGTDQATQQAFFNHAWSLAVVVDPIARKTGWFIGPACEALSAGRVIAFEEVPLAAQPPYHQRLARQGRGLAWLLPLLFLGLGTAFGYFMFHRGRV